MRKDDLHDIEHFYHALPKDALMMSSTGVAHGFDTLRFGEHFHQKGGDRTSPVAEISQGGVQFLVFSGREREWIKEVEHTAQRYEARVTMVRHWNWTPWGKLFPCNREFLLSLLWVPAEPLSAMEILARAASD
jgi:hypothetical protein